MINTVHDLLVAIRDNGVPEIEPYLNIGHNPTIGDMYEGLTKEILSKAIFHDLGLRVVSGKIKNINGELSRQIDCMVVVGEGEPIPYTDKYIYEANHVIAVVEVKKNLFTEELGDAYFNLKSVSDIAEPNRNMDITMLRNAFRLIAKTELPDVDKVNLLSFQQQMIYHALVMECFLPARIVFGYSGFADEYSLRNHFVDYILSQYIDGKGAQGFGAVSLPNLIICGDNTLIKTNGFPYVISLDVDEWLLYASYNKNPLYVFLEILWTKLNTIFALDSEMFGNDMDFETLKPLLIAIPHEIGWEYLHLNYTKQELKRFPSETQWEPTKLTNTEFIIVSQLCRGVDVRLDDKDFLKFLNANGESLKEIIEHLNTSRLVYIRDNCLELLTDQCACIITPQGYFAGENKDGRLTRWSLNTRKKSMD